MGCLSTVGGTLENKWFIKSLIECLPRHTKREDAKSALQKELSSILWVEFVHGGHLDTIWSQISKYLN